MLENLSSTIAKQLGLADLSIYVIWQVSIERALRRAVETISRKGTIRGEIGRL